MRRLNSIADSGVWFEQALKMVNGRNPACCSPWVAEPGAAERLKNSNKRSWVLLWGCVQAPLERPLPRPAPPGTVPRRTESCLVHMSSELR